MSKAVIVNLPFDGFYHSAYSEAVDYEETRHIEDRCNESDHDDDEYHWPEALRLDQGALASLLFDVTDYSAAYFQIARDYVAAFDHVAGEAFGLGVKDTRNRYNYKTNEFEAESYIRPSARMTFESMDSPREYNFTTDRVYATVPLAVMRLLFKRSAAENHATFKAVIAERFTSCDGFISFYSRHLADWLEKPLVDWDHNEFGTLLIAAMRMAGYDDIRRELYEMTLGDEGAYQAWENAVDWPKYEAKLLEARAEKLAAWIEEDKESALEWITKAHDTFDAIVQADAELFRGFELPELPYRCPRTIDMFAGV